MTGHLAGIALGVLFILVLGYGLSKSEEHYRRIDGQPDGVQE